MGIGEEGMGRPSPARTAGRLGEGLPIPSPRTFTPLPWCSSCREPQKLAMQAPEPGAAISQSHPPTTREKGSMDPGDALSPGREEGAIDCPHGEPAWWHRPRRDQDPDGRRRRRRQGARRSAPADPDGRRAARRRRAMAEACAKRPSRRRSRPTISWASASARPATTNAHTGTSPAGQEPARLGRQLPARPDALPTRSGRESSSATTSRSRPTRSSSSAPGKRRSRPCSASSGAPASAAASSSTASPGSAAAPPGRSATWSSSAAARSAPAGAAAAWRPTPGR